MRSAHWAGQCRCWQGRVCAGCWVGCCAPADWGRAHPRCGDAVAFAPWHYERWVGDRWCWCLCWTHHSESRATWVSHWTNLSSHWTRDPQLHTPHSPFATCKLRDSVVVQVMNTLIFSLSIGRNFYSSTSQKRIYWILNPCTDNMMANQNVNFVAVYMY